MGRFSKWLDEQDGRDRPRIPAPGSSPLADQGRDWFSGDFLSNLISSTGKTIAGVAEGVGAIGGAILHDTFVNPVKEIATLGKADTKHYVNELLGQVPEMARDVWHTYEPILPGGRLAGEFLDYLYENPASVALDVGSLVTGGAGAAARAGKLASRVPRIADDLATLARTGEAGRVAKTIDALAPGLKSQMAGITEFGEAVPLGGNRGFLNQLTGEMAVRPAATNPVHRGVGSVRYRVQTQPVSALEKRLALLDEALELGPSNKLRIERAQVQEMLDVAQATGTTRVLSPTASKRFGEREAKRMLRESGSGFYSARNVNMANYLEVLDTVPDEMKPSTFRYALGVDELPSAGRASLPEIAAFIAQPLSESPRLQKVAEVARTNFEHLKTLGSRYASPEGVFDSPLGQRTLESFMDELRAGGRKFQPFVARVDQLTPEESTAFQTRLREAADYEMESARRVIEITAGEPIAAAMRSETGTEWLDDLRIINLEQEAATLLEMGGEYSTLFDRLYAPLRMKYAFDNGVSYSEAPTALMLDDARRAGNIKAPAFYPQAHSLTKPLSSYLMKSRTTGMARASVPSSAKKYRGQNMEAWLRGMSEAFTTDAAEAYTRMAAEWTGYAEVLKLTDRIKNRFGVRIPDKASVPDGWVLINPDGIRVMTRRNVELKQGAARYIREGLDEQDAITRAVKDVFSDATLERDLSELARTKGELFAVPEFVAEQLNAAAHYNLPPKIQKALRVYHDGPVNSWRAMTLYLRPAYYLNNVLGNTTFLALQGANVLRPLNRRFTKKLKVMIDELAVKDAIEGGFHSPLLQAETNLGAATDTVGGQLILRAKGSRGGRATGRTRMSLQRLNATFENAARRESFLTAAQRDLARRGVTRVGNRLITSEKNLAKILRYGIDNPQAVARWVDEMNVTMNNYLALDAFERKIIRRFMAPFWPFYRHAATTLISLPFKHPLKAEALAKLNEANQDMLQELLGDVPEWVRGALSLGPGAIPGTTRFLSTRGINPFEGVTQSPLALLSPVLQTGLEQVTGRDTYTGRGFSSGDVYTDPFTGRSYAVNPQTGEVEEIAAPRPSAKEVLFDLIPPLDMARSVLSPGARYTATGEIIRDEYGEPRYPTDPTQKILQWLGISTVDVDLMRYQEQVAREKQAAQGRLAP